MASPDVGRARAAPAGWMTKLIPARLGRPGAGGVTIGGVTIGGVTIGTTGEATGCGEG